MSTQPSGAYCLGIQDLAPAWSGLTRYRMGLTNEVPSVLCLGVVDAIRAMRRQRTVVALLSVRKKDDLSFASKPFNSTWVPIQSG